MDKSIYLQEMGKKEPRPKPGHTGIQIKNCSNVVGVFPGPSQSGNVEGVMEPTTEPTAHASSNCHLVRLRITRIGLRSAGEGLPDRSAHARMASSRDFSDCSRCVMIAPSKRLTTID